VSSLKNAERFRWHFAPAVPEAVRQQLSSGAWMATAQPLKRNRRRTVFRVAGDPGLIVKHDSPVGVVDRVKALWRKPGVREYEATRLGQERGLPVPRPIGYAVCGQETLFAVEELAGCEPLGAAWVRSAQDGPLRLRLLDGLAVFAQRFAAGGVRHRDLHAGNVLVRDSAQGATCWLIDLAGASAVPPGSALAPWDAVGWLTRLSPVLSVTEAATLLRAGGYLPATADPRTLWFGMLLDHARETARRWPGRRSRLLQQSSLCDLAAADGGQWHLYHPFALATASAARRAHEENVRAHALLKDDRKRRLSRVVVEGRSYIVKEFLRPGVGPWRSDRRAWLNLYRLRPYAHPACRCHAWLRQPGRGFLVLEDVGHENLLKALRRLPPLERRPLLRAAMELIGALHVRGTLPGDMKASNLVCCEPGDRRGRLCLVDADDVRFAVRLSTAQRARNLAQFLANLPATVGLREKLRAAVAYRGSTGLDRDGLRQVLSAMPGAAAAAAAGRS